MAPTTGFAIAFIKDFHLTITNIMVSPHSTYSIAHINHIFSFSGSQGLAFEAVLNAFPSVDSFFLMGGVLTAYIVFKELEKAGSNAPR